MIFDDNADDYSFRLPEGESSNFFYPHESPFIIIINHY
jgi:hypothetical protein